MYKNTAAVLILAYVFLITVTALHHHLPYLNYSNKEVISKSDLSDNPVNSYNSYNCPIHQISNNIFNVFIPDDTPIVFGNYLATAQQEFDSSPQESIGYNFNLRAPPAA